jgi:hypothetical protein
MASFVLSSVATSAPVVRVVSGPRVRVAAVPARGVSLRDVSAAAKKSVGDLTEADLKGKVCRAALLPLRRGRTGGI